MEQCQLQHQSVGTASPHFVFFCHFSNLIWRTSWKLLDYCSHLPHFSMVLTVQNVSYPLPLRVPPVYSRHLNQDPVVFTEENAARAECWSIFKKPVALRSLNGCFRAKRVEQNLDVLPPKSRLLLKIGWPWLYNGTTCISFHTPSSSPSEQLSLICLTLNHISWNKYP